MLGGSSGGLGDDGDVMEVRRGICKLTAFTSAHQVYENKNCKR